MARTRKPKQTEPDDGAAAAINPNGADSGHNGGPPALTDDQMQALFFIHLKKARWLKNSIASLTGELRAAYKLAKAEIGQDAKAMIDDALLLETDDGQAKMEAEIARMARVARWMATPLGAQTDLFGDVWPAVDRARAAGKVARLNGEPLHPPHAPSVPQHDAWIEGWHEGEKALVEAQRRDDAVLFDGSEPLGDQPVSFSEQAA